MGSILHDVASVVVKKELADWLFFLSSRCTGFLSLKSMGRMLGKLPEPSEAGSTYAQNSTTSGCTETIKKKKKNVHLGVTELCPLPNPAHYTQSSQAGFPSRTEVYHNACSLCMHNSYPKKMEDMNCLFGGLCTKGPVWMCFSV